MAPYQPLSSLKIKPVTGILGNTSPSTTTQTSTPKVAIQIPNTASNITFGGPANVPTGQYTSDTSKIIQDPSLGTKAFQPTGLPISNTIDTKFQDKTTGKSGTGDTGGTSGYSGTGGKSGAAPAWKQGDPLDGYTYNSNIGQYRSNTQVDQKPAESPNQGYISKLADQSTARNLQLANQARDIATSAGQTMSDIGRQGARGEAGYRTTGTSPVGEGNAAVLAQTTAAQQQAVAQGANMQLTGNAQGLTAQGQTQSALSTAAGYTQPTSVNYGVRYGSPQDLANGSGAGEVPTTDPYYQTLQTYAKLLATGQGSKTPTGNPVIDAQVVRMAQQSNPGLNLNIAGAQGQSAADLTTAKSNLQAQANGAKQQMDLAINIAKAGGVTDTNQPVLNAFQQAFGANFASDQRVINFQNQIAAVKQAYEALGSPGGSVDWAHVSLNSLQSLAATVNQSAQIKIKGYDDQINNLTGGSTGGSTGGTSGGSSGPLTWDNL